MATDREKLCGPQNCDDETPSSNWPLSKLKDYASTKNSLIETAGESLAVLYWQLGHSLKLARCNFSRGQWAPYLKDLGVDPTRSSKAMAIYRTFPSLSDLQGKSVDVAYQQRARKRSLRRANAATGNASDAARDETAESSADRKTLEHFLVRLREDAEYWIHEAAFTEPAVATGLLRALNGALSVLKEIQHTLQQQAKQVSDPRAT